MLKEKLHFTNGYTILVLEIKKESNLVRVNVKKYDDYEDLDYVEYTYNFSSHKQFKNWLYWDIKCVGYEQS